MNNGLKRDVDVILGRKKNEDDMRTKEERREEALDYIYDHRWRFLGGLVAFILVISMASCMLMQSEPETVEAPVKKKPELKISPSAERNRSILVIGVDREKEDGTRSADMISLNIYNRKDSTMSSVDIPRDLYVEVPKYAGEIGELYKKDRNTFVDAVSNAYGVPITNYVIIDYDGMKKFIDKIGGVDVMSDVLINKKNNKKVGRDIIIKKGQVHFDGKHALAYVRFADDGEKKRMMRQDAVMTAVRDKVLALSPLEIKDTVKSFKSFIETDLTVKDTMAQLTSPDKLIFDKEIYEMSRVKHKGDVYRRVNGDERQRLSNTLRQKMGLRKIELPFIRSMPNEELPDGYGEDEYGLPYKK